MKDLFGNAILDYFQGDTKAVLTTSTSASLPEELPVSYLFRTYEDMPELEQQALQLCRGKILDVGCGAGVHMEYLMKKGYDVTGIDSSTQIVEVCKSKGLNVLERNFYDMGGCFDTILLLMNGTGLFESLDKTPLALSKLKQLLKPGGQILIDSSDVIYLFEEANDLPSRTGRPYYGELDYYISYKGENEDPMKWLYIDPLTFEEICAENGLKFELIMEGDHFDYLARITVP